MSLSPISSNIVNLLSEVPVTTKSDTFNLDSSFSDIFNELLNTVQETDKADKTSAVELVPGQSDDLSGLMLDTQKAEIALNLSLQIRNKVIDAYTEVMRMQV